MKNLTEIEDTHIKLECKLWMY